MSLRILAVDDSYTMRELLRHALTSAGFLVEVAEDGLDGLAKLASAKPDVIITDINMPRMDGFGFIENARKGTTATKSPILVLSTESAPELKQRAREAGATGWIVKPFSEDSLVAAIRRVAAW